jgi:hypothetical protein
MITKIGTLERAAIRAHRRGSCWAEFWEAYGHQVRAAEPFDRGKYHRLVRRLMALLVAGNEDGAEPAGDALEPWEREDTAKPSDVGTAARIDWTAAGVLNSTK